PTFPPSPPPVAVSRWKVRVGDYYPDLFTAGGLILAHGEGVMRALDPVTGKTRWKHGSWGSDILSVLGDDVLLYDPSQGGGQLVLVHVPSGAERWAHPGPPGKVTMYPVLSESVACYGYDSVTALDLDDGRPRWTAPVKSELGVAADRDLVIAATETTVSALDVSSGRSTWTREVNWGHYPEACYGLVFVCDAEGAVHALRAADGVPAWKRPVSDTVQPSFGFSSGGGVVYFGTAEGDILALRATTGEVVWKRRLGPESSSRNQWNALGAAGDMLYVGGADRNVRALRGSDGRTEWTYPADVTVRTSAPVTIDGGMTFIGTAEGFVEALSSPAGG
uniref:outer membrane protein assembly factor BamB family protein n=1 Tax=Streptomyces phytophilus TaxID=722715 RepID=UPI0015F10879